MIFNVHDPHNKSLTQRLLLPNIGSEIPCLISILFCMYIYIYRQKSCNTKAEASQYVLHKENKIYTKQKLHPRLLSKTLESTELMFLIAIAND